MSIYDFGWVKYPIAVVVILAFVTVLGLPYVAYVRKRLPEHCLLLGPHVGMAWLIIGVSWYALLGKRLPGWLLIWIGAIVLAIVAVLTIRKRTALQSLVQPLASFAAPWAVGIMTATIFMLPAISSPLVGPGYVTSFSSGNNDIGSYIAEATNMAEAGYDDVGYWYGWDPGTDPSTMAARTDHTGANALLAAVSAVLDNPVWKIGTITLMLVLASIVAGAVALARSFMAAGGPKTLAIGTFAGTTFLVWYLATNFFLAQLLSISLMLAQLALVQAAIRAGPDWGLMASIGALAAGTLLVSPEVGAVAVCLMAALVAARAVGSLLARDPIRPAIRRLWGDSAQLVGAIVLAVLVIVPFAGDLVDRTQRLSGFGIVGWSLDLRNAPATLLGIDPIGSPATPLSRLIGILIAVGLVAAFLWSYKKRKWKPLVAGIFIAALVVAGIVGAERWGVIAYQSWKLIVTLSIPAAVCAFVLILRPLTATWQLGFVAVAVALVGVNVSMGAQSWEALRTDQDTLRDTTVSQELSKLLQSDALQRQPAINVYLPSWWLTMAAPAVYQGKAALSSPSYLTGGKPGPHPYACSLYDRSMYKPRKRQKVVLTTANYMLVATPSCK